MYIGLNAPKFETRTCDSLAHSLTRVKSRDASASKKKEGKSSEFNGRNHGQVKFSLAPKVWSHEGSNLYQKNCQNFITLIGARTEKTRHGQDLGMVRLA